MDDIFAAIARDTINFGPTDDVKWRDMYTPLYPPVPEDISVYRDQRYGPAERNLLDVFVPSGDGTEKPVLVYIHGGGFFSGDKQWNERVYSNVGYHFAQKETITVVANHRLVPDVQYPGGADDMQLIRQWVFDNISSHKFGRGSTQKVFLFGHSSGGAHLCMNLFAAGDKQRAPQEPLSPPVAGLILIDVPFWYDRRKPVRAKTLRNYYGSDEEDVWGPKSALGLFESLPDESPVL
ncbi:Alpha/Beta hydrolase protein [Microdochium trichocladiopsis]|uniref:Alpha/Beta hydrolase protein n=1 Tax=Microdochium trichocladiopsis TaxID=1682393 RepID=A0A9P8YFF3_9PEZI|nr:Alpha/Beta hydrolase protein [Microdochium trichocladiopsis]KAH7035966.1 Alpha/Beta hydrolase protein [Microdochium trichocladiopsis]